MTVNTHFLVIFLPFFFILYHLLGPNHNLGPTPKPTLCWGGNHANRCSVVIAWGRYFFSWELVIKYSEILQVNCYTTDITHVGKLTNDADQDIHFSPKSQCTSIPLPLFCSPYAPGFSSLLDNPFQFHHQPSTPLSMNYFPKYPFSSNFLLSSFLHSDHIS